MGQVGNTRSIGSSLVDRAG